MHGCLSSFLLKMIGKRREKYRIAVLPKPLAANRGRVGTEKAGFVPFQWNRRGFTFSAFSGVVVIRRLSPPRVFPVEIRSLVPRVFTL